MLKSFAFRNGYSFRETAVLNMEAERAMKDNTDFIIHRPNDNQQILPVAALYGGNAGGKSNIIRALVAMVNNIRGISDEIINKPFEIRREWDSIFEHHICLLIDDYEYSYKYTADNEYVLGAGEYLKESLFRRSSTSVGTLERVYERVGSKVDFGGMLDKNAKSAIKMAADNKETLIITTAGRLGILGCEEVVNWCERFISMTHLRGDSDRNIYLRRLATWMNDKHDKIERLSEILRKFDPTIAKVEIHPDNAIEAARSSHSIYLWHKSSDPNYCAPILITDESNGTKKLVELFNMIDTALEEGRVLVLDELDSMLHPLVFKELPALFNSRSKNKNGAQLIFAAHNTVIMNREDIRRDEIHFVRKDSNTSESSIYRLSDVVDESGKKIRMDASYERWYLDSRLGATPVDFYDLPVGGV